jgi:hypothetical protein
MFTLELVKAAGTRVKESPIRCVILKRCFDDAVYAMQDLEVDIIGVGKLRVEIRTVWNLRNSM